MSLLDINPKKSLVLLIDAQERLINAMPQAPDYIGKIALYLQAFKILDFPFLISEQYPKGLGPTVPQLTKGLDPEVTILPKTTFSCWRDAAIQQKIKDMNPENIIILGMETHVCVYQTACDLKQNNYAPILLEDGLISRKESDRQRALKQLEQEGHCITSFECLAMAIVKDAKDPRFKQISALLKQL